MIKINITIVFAVQLISAQLSIVSRIFIFDFSISTDFISDFYRKIMEMMPILPDYSLNFWSNGHRWDCPSPHIPNGLITIFIYFNYIFLVTENYGYFV